MLLFSPNSFLFSSKNLKMKIFKTMILSFVRYGYETWFLTLTEERRLGI